MQNYLIQNINPNVAIAFCFSLIAFAMITDYFESADFTALKKRYADLEAEYDSLVDEFNELQNKNSKDVDDYNSLLDEFNELEDKLTKKDGYIAHLKRKIRAKRIIRVERH
jgi:hypothetical protein